ncbi:MAG: hypothetical protein QXT68_00645 [Halobacteria archaeon]
MERLFWFPWNDAGAVETALRGLLARQGWFGSGSGFERARPRGLHAGAAQRVRLEVRRDGAGVLVRLAAEPLGGTQMGGDGGLLDELAREGQKALANHLLQLNFSWFEPGRLAAFKNPRRASSPRLATEFLRRQRVEWLLCLDDRCRSLPGEEWAETLHAHLPDGEGPAPGQAREVVSSIEGALGRGRVAGVHCAEGTGRTGTALALLLVARGLPEREALAEAERRRSPYFLLNSRQRAAVAAFETGKG